MYLSTPHLQKKYQELRLPIGTDVYYVGSITSLHGTYKVFPCACPPCWRESLRGKQSVRYALDKGDKESVIRHVRHFSVTPYRDENPLNVPVLSEMATTKCVSATIRAEWPDLRFGAYVASDRHAYIDWTGGPTEGEMATILAPFMASYRDPISPVPHPMKVKEHGREIEGTPVVARCHLEREKDDARF